MDAIRLDEWELVPGLGSSFFMEECTAGGGKDQDQLLFGSDLVVIDMGHFTLHPASHPCTYDCILDEEEAMKPPVQAASAQQQQHAVEFKDIGVVQAEPRRGEFASEVTEVMVSDAEEEEEIAESPAAEKEVCDEDEVMVEAASDHLGDEEGEGVEGDGAGVECPGFSVGKLKVNGVGALCSFGVAAATLCILVLGGRPQQQRKVQDHKSQFQMYAHDEVDHSFLLFLN